MIGVILTALCFVVLWLALYPPGVALRGLFIVDPKSTVRQITINDLPVGRDVDEVLRLVKAFQVPTYIVRQPASQHVALGLASHMATFPCSSLTSTVRCAPWAGGLGARP